MRKSLRFLALAGSCFVALPAIAQTGDYWYYCESTHTYYPYFPYYLAQCAEGSPIVPQPQ